MYLCRDLKANVCKQPQATAVLQASIPEFGLECKVTKLPLGALAMGALPPEDQLKLAEYFSSATSSGTAPGVLVRAEAG